MLVGCQISTVGSVPKWPRAFVFGVCKISLDGFSLFINISENVS